MLYHLTSSVTLISMSRIWTFYIDVVGQRFRSIYEPRHDKTNKVTVRPAKTQISLGIRPVWSESSLCAQWVAKDLSFLHAVCEDSDQTGRMSRLIWVFAGRTTILLVLSCCGSFMLHRLQHQTNLEVNVTDLEIIHLSFRLKVSES